MPPEAAISHPSNLRATAIFIVNGGAILIRADGVKLYPKGGPDNNPTLGQIEALASVLLLTDRITDRSVRTEITNVVQHHVEAAIEQLASH